MEGEGRVKSVTMRANISCDCKSVWEIVTDNVNYAWRSDLSKIEVLGETRFDEYTKNGFITHFCITVKEPCREYRFDMENQNMCGRWKGIFEDCGGTTRITFTEEVQAKNPVMNLFLKGYLKKQQAAYMADLQKAVAEKARIRSMDKSSL